MTGVPTAYAASSRQSGFGPPTSTGAFAVPGYPVPQSSSAFDFLDVDNRSPTSMNAWLEETNRRNEALARYARAILYPKKRDETQQNPPPHVSNFPVTPNAQRHQQSIGAGSAVRTTPGQNVAPNGPRSEPYPGFGTANQGVSGSLSAGRPSAVELFERMKRQNGVRGADGNVSQWSSAGAAVFYRPVRRIRPNGPKNAVSVQKRASVRPIRENVDFQMPGCHNVCTAVHSRFGIVTVFSSGGVR